MKRVSWRRLASVLVLSALALSGTAAAAAEPDRGWTGNLKFLLGGRWLDHSDWKPVDDQIEIGIESDFAPVSWPVNLAADLLFSLDWDTEDGKPLDVDESGSTLEIDLGIRKHWDTRGRLRPFVGGGLALVHSRVQSDVFDVSDSDWGVGFWTGGGLDIRIANKVYVGVEARYSSVEVTILGDDKDAGGVHVGAHLGFQW